MPTHPSGSKVSFVDEVDIVAVGGDGGNGCISFRREKFVPRGGPDGGDGGDGGSVYLRADAGLNTLQHLAGRHHWRAGKGAYGKGKDRHGRRGRDMIVRVPPGTMVHDADHGILLKDLAQPGDQICVAKGGRGGRGNAAFKGPTNQAPRECEPGEPGQERRLHLVLKLIADAGLVGMPNAGKSTLLSRLSAARPKIAPYPFTTLSPHLGIVELSGYRRFVMADIPGLVQGAHAGVGLGDEFLRHIERTRVLIHVLDICPATGEPSANYRRIRKELGQYSQRLAGKPEIVVANKMDLTGSEKNLRRLEADLDGEVLAISAATGKGLDRLIERIWELVQGELAHPAGDQQEG